MYKKYNIKIKNIIKLNSWNISIIKVINLILKIKLLKILGINSKIRII